MSEIFLSKINEKYARNKGIQIEILFNNARGG